MVSPVVVVLAVLTLVATSSSTAYQLLALTGKGLLHVDSSGTVLDWYSQSVALPYWKLGHPMTIIPQNGTVCWFRTVADLVEGGGGSVHCAPLGDLNRAWTLPRSSQLPLYNVIALAFDWAGQNWHLTGYRMRFKGLGSFVCSYLFDRCVDIGRIAETGRENFLSAYDLPNRLLFRMVIVSSGRRLYVSQLDGSEQRRIPVGLGLAFDMGVDPVGRRVYWVERDDGDDIVGPYTLCSVDYDGNGKTRVWRRTREASGQYLVVTVTGGGPFIVWGPKYEFQISILGLKNNNGGSDATRAEAEQGLVKINDLRTIIILSPSETAFNMTTCKEEYEDGCKEMCVPTMVDGVASSTCYCPEGEQLLGLRCRQKHPLYAMTLGANSLRIVKFSRDISDRNTWSLGAATTAVSNIADGTRVAMFWAGGEAFFLFWVDDGGLYRAPWYRHVLYGEGTLLVPATEFSRVVDVAVDWNQRQLLWMKHDGKEMTIQLSQLNGSLPRTVLNVPWSDQHALAIHESGSMFTYIEMALDDAWTVQQRRMDTGDLVRKTPIITAPADSADVVVAVSPTQDGFLDRILWLDRTTQSVYEFPSTLTGTLWDEDTRKTVVTHPSLGSAGGLDVFNDIILWTEGSNNILWMFDTSPVEDIILAQFKKPSVLALGIGSRALRLLHPWNQPEAQRRVCGRDATDCSQLCVRSYSRSPYSPGGQCVCADGFQLEEDLKTCTVK